MKIRGLIKWFAASAAGIVSCAVAAPSLAADVFVSADITVSETWTADNNYILTDRIYVTNGATLTIEAGTTVRGEPEFPSGAQNPGTLTITRGSKIRALGTRLKPITFTDLDDDNIGGNPGTSPYDTKEDAEILTGQWGGVILLSYGYVATNTVAAADPAKEQQIEGLTAVSEKGFYGGCSEWLVGPYGRNCDDSDSGTMTYVSVRYGGFNLSANNEINGLTLGGVGRETDLDYIEVVNNKDDGVELFGGAAQIKHLISANGGDDGLDYDEGWRGKAQFVFVLQGTPGSDKSDKGFEQDGGTVADASQPFAIPTLYNMTVVGLGQKATYTDRLKNTVMHFRDNGGGRHFNSAYLDFGGAAAMIEGGSAACDAAGSSGQRSLTPYAVDGIYHLGPAGDNQLDVQDNVFYCLGAPAADRVPTGLCSVSLVACCSTAQCVGGGGDTCVDQAPTYGGDAGKIHRDNGLFSTIANDNTYVACGGALPILTMDRSPVADPSKPDPVEQIDPRPVFGGPLAATNRATPNDGFFTAANYKGAFAPGSYWAKSWSTLGRLGYLERCVDGVGAVPDEVAGLAFVDKSNLVWPRFVNEAATYDLVRANTPNGFLAGTCVETNGSDGHTLDSATPAVNAAFYYLVRADNACGSGTLGRQSNGTERTGVSCP